MEKKTYTNHDDIRADYDTNKYDLFYEDQTTKYEVRHIGTILFCYNPERNLGMGVINNFPITGFYGIERPKPVETPVVEESDCQDEREASDPFEDPLNEEETEEYNEDLNE